MINLFFKCQNGLEQNKKKTRVMILFVLKNWYGFGSTQVKSPNTFQEHEVNDKKKQGRFYASSPSFFL